MQGSQRQRQAFRSVTATVLSIESGETLDVDTMAETAALGTLVLEGFLVREMATSGRFSADLLGPDDLVRMAEVEQHTSPLRCTTRWTAATAVRLALLDADFARRSARWPEIAEILIERAARPGDRLASGHAIATPPSIDMRLLASLWEWASHWGFVNSSGVRLHLPLSHSRLGRLIGAQRPTVTATLGRLRAHGLVEQFGAGEWLLHPPASKRPHTSAAGSRMLMLDDLPTLLPARARRRAGISKARPAEAAVRSTANSDAVRALQRRLAEQRKTLGIASVRHEQMLARLQRASDQLRANSAMLSRLTRQSPPNRAPGQSPDLDELPGPHTDPSAAVNAGDGGH